ncbi:MAG TPA: hypothetical protein VLG44_01205 [Chlamydiales bacterium]|nr:hypothetical protein [Chlamydiales bacterium]
MSTATSLIHAKTHIPQQKPTVTFNAATNIFGKWAGSGSGFHRECQVAKLAFSWARELGVAGGERTEAAIKTTDHLGLAGKIGHTFGGAVAAHEEYKFQVEQQKAGAVSDDSVSAKLRKFVVKIFELISDVTNLLTFWIPTNPVKITAHAADITVESNDIAESFHAIDAQNAKIAEGRAKGAKEHEFVRPTEEKRLSYIKIAKATCSITTAAIGLLGIIFKIALIPSVVLLTISTATVIFAIWSHFYKETMTHNLEDMYAKRRFELASGAV